MSRAATIEAALRLWLARCAGCGGLGSYRRHVHVPCATRPGTTRLQVERCSRCWELYAALGETPQVAAMKVYGGDL